MNARPILTTQNWKPVSRNPDDFPILAERLGADAPRQLWLIGDPALLAARKTALFCSARCPGVAIPRAHDAATNWSPPWPTGSSSPMAPPVAKSPPWLPA